MALDPVVENASQRLRLLVWMEMKRRNVTQIEMARRIGYTSKHVSQLMTGTVPMRPDVAELMLATLGLDLVIDVKERVYPRWKD